MAIITLTSDFGLKDHYVASMKGIILSESLDIKIIDISHHIPPFNTMEAAYIVKNASSFFPKNTINIIAVDIEYSVSNKLLIAKTNDQYFITSDNGILHLLTDGCSGVSFFEINTPKANNFSSVEILVKTACNIAKGVNIKSISKQINSIRKYNISKAHTSNKGNKIIGHVTYTDNYGNVITNISRAFFEKAKKNKSKFKIIARNHKLDKIYNKYNDIENTDPENKNIKDGTMLALFNSTNFLELAIYKSNLDTVGGASTLLGLYYGESITIIFDEE